MDYRLTKLYGKLQQNTIREALGLSTYNYEIPTDPKEKLYDFYYLTLLGKPESLEMAINQRIWGYWADKESATGDPAGAVGMQSGYFNEEQIQEIVAAVGEAQNKISNDLQADLLDATYFALAAEFRHVTDSNKLEEVMAFADKEGYGNEFAKWYSTYTTLQKMKTSNMIKSLTDKSNPMSKFAVRADVFVPGETEEQQKQATEKFLTNSAGYVASYSAAKNAFSDDWAFVDLCEKVYFGLKWHSAYGGKAWGKIAQGWKKLYEAKTYLDRMVWVDHILDLEHNTGAMLNKVQRWAKGGSWHWIKQALDYKRDSEKPLDDFLDRISPSLSFLDKRIRYAITGMAEDHPASDELDKQIKNTKVQTNSGSSAEDTSFGQAGDSVSTSTGIKGTIFKIGTTGKAYVNIDTSNLPAGMKAGTEDWYIKFDKQGKPEAYLHKANLQQKPIESVKTKNTIGNLVKQDKSTSSNASGASGFNNFQVGDKVDTSVGITGTVTKISSQGEIYVKIPTGNSLKASTLKFSPHGGELIKYHDDKHWVNYLSFPKKVDTAQKIFGTLKPQFKSGDKITIPDPFAKSAPQPVSVAAPAPVAQTAANNTVLHNQGLYTDLLKKFHPKKIAHTGPAGQAGVKSLIVKLDNHYSVTGRNAYTGHLKVKASHSGDNLLYYNKNINGAGITYHSAGKDMKPWKDKALAINLQFATVKKKFVIKSGTLIQAVLGPNVIIDGPVTLQKCVLEGCGLSKDGLEKALFNNCTSNSAVLIDNNKFANSSAYVVWNNILATSGTLMGTNANVPILALNSGPVTGVAMNSATPAAKKFYQKFHQEDNLPY